jgi:hypothetical protein
VNLFSRGIKYTKFNADLKIVQKFAKRSFKKEWGNYPKVRHTAMLKMKSQMIFFCCSYQLKMVRLKLASVLLGASSGTELHAAVK